MQLKSLLPRMREWVNQSNNQSTNRSCVLSRRYMVLPSSFPFRFLPNLTLTLLTWTIWRAPTNASKWRIGFNSAFKGLRVLPSHASQDHCLPELRYRLKFPTVFLGNLPFFSKPEEKFVPNHHASKIYTSLKMQIYTSEVSKLSHPNTNLHVLATSS